MDRKELRFVIHRLLAMLSLLLIGQAAIAADQTPLSVTDIRSPEFVASLDGAMRSHMSALAVPGMAVAVVRRDGTMALNALGHGARGDKPVAIDPQTSVLPIASISKTFAMVAMMRLVDRGLIDLDAPAQRYVDFPLPTYPGARAFTVRDLTRHEAGFEERWLATGAGGAKPDPRSWRDIMADTAPQLIAPPGSFSSYSNYGAALIGYIVEKVARKPFADVLSEDVLKPLGMTSTSVADPLPPELGERQLMGWKVSGGMVRPDQHFYNVRSAPAGRVQTTLPDMARYMTMLLNEGRAPEGGQFLSPQAMQTLLHDVKRLHPKFPGLAAIFAEKDVSGLRFIGHGGDGGAHHTDMLISPQLGIGIFLVDLSAPGPQARDAFARAILPSLLPGAGLDAIPAMEATPTANLARYAGSYRHFRWAFTSIEKVLGLTSEFAIKDSGKGTLIVTGRLGPGEYVPAGDKGLFRQRITGEWLFFRTDESGRTLVNMGTFPFVTAFRLDMVDTQSFNQVAFWVFVVGLTLVGLVSCILGIRALRQNRRRAGIWQMLVGLALTISGVGLFLFLAIAASLPEAEIQQAIPAMARPILAIPPAATFFVVAFGIGLILRRIRLSGWWEHMTAVLGIAAFAMFVAWLVHWHAFGWQFP